MIWEPRCAAACDNRFLSDVSLNQTIWEMQEQGWHIEGDLGEVLCPEHHDDGNPVDEHLWDVYCMDCDWEESHWSEAEAKKAGREHEWDHNCNCCDHWTSVRSPEQRSEEEKKNAVRKIQMDRITLERKAWDRYYAYLVDKDQQGRAVNEDVRYLPPERPTKREALFMALYVLAVVIAIAFMTWGI